MKTLIVALTAACVGVAGYFGIRYFTRKDLGFTPTRKYVRNLAENLLHIELTSPREAGTTPKTTMEQAAWQTVPLMLLAATLKDIKDKVARCLEKLKPGKGRVPALILPHPNHKSWDGLLEFPLGDDFHPLSWSQREIRLNACSTRGDVNGDS